MSAVRTDGNDRFCVWIHFANFGSVDSAVSTLWYFHEAHAGSGIDHAGIDRKSASIDHLSSRRNTDRTADCFNLPVANDDRAILDVSAADSHDVCVANGECSPGRKYSLLQR